MGDTLQCPCCGGKLDHDVQVVCRDCHKIEEFSRADFERWARLRDQRIGLEPIFRAPTTPDELFERVDWDILQRQKKLLVELSSSVLNGLIHMIDDMQDIQDKR